MSILCVAACFLIELDTHTGANNKSELAHVHVHHWFQIRPPIERVIQEYSEVCKQGIKNWVEKLSQGIEASQENPLKLFLPELQESTIYQSENSVLHSSPAVCWKKNYYGVSNTYL
jgi:flagellar biosynthesis chaperone FliJ